jgi:hypothetical protein
MLLGGRRMQQSTIDRSGEGDGYDSGWRRSAIGDGGRQPAEKVLTIAR